MQISVNTRMIRIGFGLEQSREREIVRIARCRYQRLFIFNNMLGNAAIAAIFYLGLIAGYTHRQMSPDSFTAARE